MVFEPKDIFQFHKGTIRTKVFAKYGIKDVISIP